MKKPLLDKLLGALREAEQGVRLTPPESPPASSPQAEPVRASKVPSVTFAGRLPDGRIDMQRLAHQQGVCLTCARWQPDEYGDGLCPLGRRAHGWYDGNPAAPVITTAAHRCAAKNGAGWQAK